MQRQKSTSRRILSRVKQGIANRSKAAQSIRPIDSETSFVRRLSARGKQSSDVERRSQSLDVGRPSVENGVGQAAECSSLVAPSIQRSFTDSTVSTTELLGESHVEEAIEAQRQHSPASPSTEGQDAQSSSPGLRSSPSPHPTPRPPPKQRLPPESLQITSNLSPNVPCVDLYVVSDTTSVDIHSKRDIWVAMEATVRSMSTVPHHWKERTLAMGTTADCQGVYMDCLDSCSSPDPRSPLSNEGVSKRTFGTVSSLGLCFKPVEGCQIRELVGQKTLKNLRLGQRCSLFIKLRVPKIRVRDSTIDPDQESLFIELESIVGTLKTEVLHLEARYRHTLLPSDNIVSVRHVCKIKRPKMESRWSIIGHSEPNERSTEVYMMLARYLASRYLSEEASKLLAQYIGSEAAEQTQVRQVFESQENDMQNDEVDCSASAKPSVVVTDIDLDSSESNPPPSESFSTAPSTPLETNEPSRTSPMARNIDHGARFSPSSLVPSKKLALPIVTASKTTTSLSTNYISSTASMTPDTTGSSEPHDSARTLWRHIRRTSLSAKQLEDMTPEPLQYLEASDESLKELRRKAIANKRSVGAETLKAWKWDESVYVQKHGEAPWM